MDRRPRQDSLRIAPIRRNTDSANWGLRSVPGVLSDFQRHTSHSTIPPIPSQDDTPSSDENEHWIQSLPAFLAFPTGLAALRYAQRALGSTIAVASLVVGVVLLLGVPLTLINRRSTEKQSPWSTMRLAGGLACLAACQSPVPKVVGLSVGALGLAGTSNIMQSLRVQALGYALWTVISLISGGDILLAGVVAWLATDNGASIEPLTGTVMGCSLLVGNLIWFQPSILPVMVCVIASGALGVFLLARGDIVPSRANPLASAVLAAVVDFFLNGSSNAWSLVPVLPCLIVRPCTGSTGTPDSSPAWSVLDSILAHDDTRGIFYFFLLNFSFMLVQLLYSMLSHSLGLLSDSIHMFFDCLALLVGLVASILAKLPPSTRFPYGLAMVETVSGFANGILLLAISVGVLFEAFERISHPVELEKMAELIVVSFLGLLVNLVGIFAFGHTHSHSDGSHSHSHSHVEPKHTHSHSDDHDHGHDHTHSHSHSHSSTHTHSHSHSSEGSDNMYGIFLHIVADTLGSVGVIISTLLTYYFGWPGFDAVASIFIALLTFASAIPLVTSSARRLLLGLSDRQEYELRDVLNDISTTTGVVSYTVPKFWDDGHAIRGTIHVQYARGANANIVREKVRDRLASGGIAHSVVQMEEEDAACWCRRK